MIVVSLVVVVTRTIKVFKAYILTLYVFTYNFK